MPRKKHKDYDEAMVQKLAPGQYVVVKQIGGDGEMIMRFARLTPTYIDLEYPFSGGEIRFNRSTFEIHNSKWQYSKILRIATKEEIDAFKANLEKETAARQERFELRIRHKEKEEEYRDEFGDDYVFIEVDEDGTISIQMAELSDEDAWSILTYAKLILDKSS